MKIIDLLNKIANREEVPKKIEFEGEIYEFSKNIHGYLDGKNKDSFRAMVNWRYLNNEVEILEEEKKIPGKLEMIGCNVKLNILGKEMIVGTDTPLVTKTCIVKINEIIDYLKSKGDK